MTLASTRGGSGTWAGAATGGAAGGATVGAAAGGAGVGSGATGLGFVTGGTTIGRETTVGRDVTTAGELVRARVGAIRTAVCRLGDGRSNGLTGARTGAQTTPGAEACWRCGAVKRIGSDAVGAPTTT
jgi:hypothetical protein